MIELERIEDERGFFARTFCRQRVRRARARDRVAQANTAFNQREGTLRGLHYQAAPHEEAKLVRCTRGAVYDVIVDLRPGSASFTRWIGVELTAENDATLYVPQGFAHGYQTLEDDTETSYLMSAPTSRRRGAGVRWDDPASRSRGPTRRSGRSTSATARWPDFTG